MWQPDPAWTPLRGGGGPATVGLWRTRIGETDAIVKRLRRPEPDEAALLGDPRHAAYWRREVEAALEPAVLRGPGLIPGRMLRVEEDEGGATLWTEEVHAVPPSTLFVARALGRFAGAAYAEVGWAARQTLVDRLGFAEARGGWPTLRRTTIADTADHLWEQRGHWLGRYAAGPAGRLHGDAVPANFLAVVGQDAVAVDWQGFGIGPVGTDLGYLSLSAREDFEVLLDTFLAGVREQRELVAHEEDAVRLAATVMAVYTVFSRAEWALSRVAPGEGALAGKYGHPSVAPHLRALQRQIPRIEALLG